MNKKLWILMIAVLVGLFFVVKHFDRSVPLSMATKTCLITGASSGIGQNIAIEMVKRGWKVIGVARRAPLLDALKNKLGTETFVPFVCDVSDREQVHAVAEAIKAQGLRPTLFFLNAGTGAAEQKWNVSTELHQRTFATNYLGTIAWIEEFLGSVKEVGGGTFVATSSVAALLATPGSAAYATSKRALVHCFESLRRQYLYDNIGFVTVLPGPTDTEMLKGGAKGLPCMHTAEDEARYIVEGVFAGETQIEPSWLYSTVLRLLSFLPDAVVVKFLGS